MDELERVPGPDTLVKIPHIEAHRDIHELIHHAVVEQRRLSDLFQRFPGADADVRELGKLGQHGHGREPQTGPHGAVHAREMCGEQPAAAEAGDVHGAAHDDIGRDHVVDGGGDPAHEAGHEIAAGAVGVGPAVEGALVVEHVARVEGQRDGQHAHARVWVDVGDELVERVQLEGLLGRQREVDDGRLRARVERGPEVAPVRVPRDFFRGYRRGRRRGASSRLEKRA